MRIISSELALREVLALAAADDLSLTELARSVASGPSAAQRALEILLGDGIAERNSGTGRPRYRLALGPKTEHLVGLAQAELPADQALAIIARANPAVEFLARTRGEVLAVFAPASRAFDQARAARLVDRIAEHLGDRVEYLDHDDVRRRLLDEPQLRNRAARMGLIHGTLDHSFPDRSRHGACRGNPLGKPHPRLELPSRHALQKLRRRHGLASLKLFGSAVRTDFRPDSDVDALIRFRPGVGSTMGSLVELEAELERLFQRDVHVTREDALESEMRTSIEREVVPLL